MFNRNKTPLNWFCCFLLLIVFKKEFWIPFLLFPPLFIFLVWIVKGLCAFLNYSSSFLSVSNIQNFSASITKWEKKLHFESFIHLYWRSVWNWTKIENLKTNNRNSTIHQREYNLFIIYRKRKCQNKEHNSSVKLYHKCMIVIHSRCCF